MLGLRVTEKIIAICCHTASVINPNLEYRQSFWKADLERSLTRKSTLYEPPFLRLGRVTQGGYLRQKFGGHSILS